MNSRSQYLMKIALVVHAIHSLASLYPMAGENTADFIGKYDELI